MNSRDNQNQIFQDQLKQQRLRKIFKDSHLYNANTSPNKQQEESFKSPQRLLKIGNDTSEQERMGYVYYVPCRWSNSGWKYVNRDPADHNYFNNPNRLNFTGLQTPNKLSPLQKERTNQSFDMRSGIKQAQFQDNEQQMNQTQFMNKDNNMSTTYSRFFVPNKLSELNDWQKQRNKDSLKIENLKRAIDDKYLKHDKLAWAGTVHERKTFHKSKDFIADWTNVLFRN